MLELKQITEENFDACISLKVHESQKRFVADNLMSLAQAYLAVSNHSCIPIPFALYDGEIPVGFLMMAYHAAPDQDDPEELFHESIYEIWRLMIDERFQGKGYGKQALEKAVAYLRTQPYGESKKIVLSYEPDNFTAKRLYASAGFAETGNIFDGEAVAVLDL